MNPVFERVDFATASWDRIERFSDRTLFQGPSWLKFLATTQHGEPVLAALRRDGNVLGYFTGLIVRKFGLPILGSPFPGWTTSYMGFNLLPGVPHRLAMQALVRFAFEDLGCIHVEVMDRHASPDSGAGYEVGWYAGYEIDLTKQRSTLFSEMSSACRRCIRKAKKSGVAVEEVKGIAFAQEYYEQLKEVFRRQGLVPTYGVYRVRELIRWIGPTGNLLLLRARDPAGRSIATGIFPSDGRAMYFWGGASRTETRFLRPNEAIQWHAIRYWKNRGVQTYDMGGAGGYKSKYGGEAISVPWFRRSRYKSLHRLRNVAERLTRTRQVIFGRLSALTQVGSAPDRTG